MIRIPELTPELDEAVEKQDPVRVKRVKGGYCFIIREETLERMKQGLIEEELDRSFFEFEDETPLDSEDPR
jgi:hypothetical protein